MPLDRFMSRDDYERVMAEMRLPSGQLFPVPVTLPVSRDVQLTLDSEIALRDSRNDLLAVMRIEEIFDRSPDEALLLWLVRGRV